MIKLRITHCFLLLITAFICSTYHLEANDTDETRFRKMAKAELHIHLGGAYPLDYLMRIATPEQKETLMNDLQAIAKGVSYQEIFQVFKIVAQIVNTDQRIEEGTYALCRSLEEDGVAYAEIRTGLKDLGNGFEGYLNAVLSGLKRGCSGQFEGRLILSLQRNSSLEVARKTIDLALKYKNQGIVAIDISGDSTSGDIETIMPELLRAKNHGLFMTVHMGESPNEMDQMKIIEALHPDRIGHGVFLTDKARAWVLDNRIPIEVCLTSSLLVKMVDDYLEHPGINYCQNGHPIVICTDDPLIFRTSLSKEFELLAESGFFDFKQIEEIARAGFTHAFPPIHLSHSEKGLPR